MTKMLGEAIGHVVAFALDNVSGLLFVGGASLVYVGIRNWSAAAAAIFAGALLMAVGAAPYLRRRKS